MPSLADFNDLPSAMQGAFDIVVTCQHMEPPRDDLTCMIKAIKGQMKTLKQPGDEESLNEVPGLLTQIKDLQRKN